MAKNIAFVGGVHGVGKSSLCKLICEKTGFNYISASETIKLLTNKNHTVDKLVENIDLNQEVLLIGLRNIINPEEYYLIDGHYCLLNSRNESQKIDFDFFYQLNLMSLSIVIGEPEEIKYRLELRDNTIWKLNDIIKFQNEEIEYAKELSIKLSVGLNIGNLTDYTGIVESFNF